MPSRYAGSDSADLLSLRGMAMRDDCGLRREAARVGRTTPAGPPDGIGSGARARGHRAIRARVGSCRTSSAWVESCRVDAVADSPAVRADAARGSQCSGPRGCDRDGLAAGSDPYPRRSARHPSRRITAPRCARPHRVRPAIKPLSRGGVRSPGTLWALAQRSRGGADSRHRATACCFSSTTRRRRRCTRHEQSLRWPWRSSSRVTVRKRTSRRFA